jgi:predicted Na+-dependent transporter
MRLFIIGAIVLIVFAIVASAQATGAWLGVAWPTWLAASLLAYFTDLALGQWKWEGWRTRPPQ